MTTSKLLVTIDSNLIEVKGQLNENGQGCFCFKNAVRQLSESVDLLVECIDRHSADISSTEVIL